MDMQAQHLWLQEQLQALGGDWRINQFGHLFKIYPQADLTAGFDFGKSLLAKLEQAPTHIEFILDSHSLRIEIFGHKQQGLQSADFALARALEA